MGHDEFKALLPEVAHADRERARAHWRKFDHALGSLTSMRDDVTNASSIHGLIVRLDGMIAHAQDIAANLDGLRAMALLLEGTEDG